MDDAAVIAIGVVVALVVAAGAWSYFHGPNSPMATKWRRRLNELEVASRMGKSEDIIEALRESSIIYLKLGKRNEAETVLRRAMLISKQEYGEMNKGMAPIMEDFARVMDSMHRKKEAEQMRKNAQKIRQRDDKQ